MKTLVLLHGHGVDSKIWEPLSTKLSDYQVLTPDYSSEVAYQSIEAYADWLYQWLISVGVEKCTLLGHSMGGYITLAFAEKYPDLLEGFGLFHSTAYADDEAKKEQRKKTLAFMENHGAAAFIRQSGPNMYAEEFAEKNPELVKNHVERYSQLPTDAVITGFKAIMNRPDRTHILSETSLPVLFIFGKQDKLIVFEKNIGLSELPPKASTVILTEAGHMGMIEDTDACADSIKTFLETN